MSQPSGDPRRDPPRGDVAITVVLTEAALDPAAAVEAVAHDEAGGTALFLGTVRDHHDGATVSSLDYEAWEDRAREELGQVASDVVVGHGGVRAVYVAHRLGHLEVGEVSVVVAASAPHRAEAFDAARDLIDRIKASVPIWKHEHLRDGSSRWPGADAQAPAERTPPPPS